MKSLLRSLAAATALLYFSSCQKTEAPPENNRTSVNLVFYALTDNNLEKCSTTDPENPVSSVAITNTESAEPILAIDFRPATGQLYGIGATSRLYVINPETGVARMIGAAPFTPAISGAVAAFDFNPTVDRIRLITSTGQNLRLNPETGAVVATDGDINGVSGAMINAAAYTSNFAGTTTTTLYDIDVTTDKLYKQNPPNNGTLELVGNLNLNVEGDGGFDIAPDNDLAMGLFQVGGKATLFTIDLMTGAATVLRSYTKTTKYRGLAIPTREVAYATTSANTLLIFNPSSPATTISKTITGLAAGETIHGIDMRPLNGQLFALGSTGRLYAINSSSGAATAVGGVFSTALSGTHFGFDFNPTVDRIRIVSNTGQNLRVNPADGSVTVDGALNPGTPMITAAAYTNNFAGTTTTQLFDIDTNTDKLYLQNPPNNGTLVEVGSLGVNAEASNGFDIGGTSKKAWAILTVGGVTKLYSINTTTGSATASGDLSTMVTGFTIGLGF
jgi:hypothetical protein